MRLFTKIFLCGMLVFGLAFSVSGYFLLHYSMESSVAREVDFALKQYQYDKFTVQSAMLTYSEAEVTVSFEEDFLPGSVGIYTIWQFYPKEELFLEYVEPSPDTKEPLEGASSSEDKEPSEMEPFSEAKEPLEGESFSEAKEPSEGEPFSEAKESSEMEPSPDAKEPSEGASFLEHGQFSEGQMMSGDVLSTEGYIIPKGQILTEGGKISQGLISWSERPDRFFGALTGELSAPAAFYSEDKEPLYTQIEGIPPSFLDSLSEDAHAYQLIDAPGGGAVLVGSVLYWEGWNDMGLHGTAEGTAEEDAASAGQNGRKIYFVTQWDVGKTIKQQDTMRQYFMRCYLAAMAAGMALLGLLSVLLTGPLKRMSKAARRMTEGCYEERLAAGGRDEIGELAESFNQMAHAVEEKVEALSKAAREKEDFVANFAHELKTPLTSIIGYADTMYQKELSREEIRRASWHIWNEGMRLEALSLKLMELTVLGRQDFPRQEMPADELLQDAAEGLAPLFEKEEISFSMQAEPAYVRVDYDLLKTLLMNLVDNSIKAGADQIELQGRKKDEGYWVCVADNGCGMEEEVLSRITEAFYMVDKARSRKQHGAGLGLALGDRIARIHGSGLQFESSKGVGTKVSFTIL